MRLALAFILISLLGGLAAPGLAQEPALAVMPDADRLAPATGEPPARQAFAGSEPVGYVFSSAAVAQTTGYGGKPLDLLIGIDMTARITGVVILEEHEPILATGSTRADLDAFVGQFAGRDLRDAATLDPVTEDGIDAVSGATITSLMLTEAVMNSARQMARQLGLLEQGGVDLDNYAPASFEQLVADGAIAHRRITLGEAAERLAVQGGTLFPPAMGENDAAERLVDLYVALATPAMIGRNLLGDEGHAGWRVEHAAGDSAIWIGGDGRYSIKGTAWRRDGVFDRLALSQEGRLFDLTAAMHENVSENALELREQALFTLPAASGFRGDRPFRIELRIADHADASKTTSVAIDYTLPPSLLLPAVVEVPIWRQVWERRWLDIAILAVALAVLATMLVLEDAIARRPGLWRAMRLGFLTFTLVWLGGYATAQLSVVNILTFADALRGTFRWQQFLIEPLIFILWSFVAIALLFWGRGVFCGWLCPFGALKELLWIAARKLRLPAIEVPFALHERLRAIKFLVFLGLVAVSLGSLAMAHQLAEVEPFKTVIVLKFAHAWPFVAYALIILGVGLFVQRAFCRYLCPLGAALALPARLKQFDWLKRRWQCGQRCHICATTCPVQAIQPSGDIHPGECIHCLRCQINYFDDKTCPPLIERRRRGEARERAG